MATYSVSNDSATDVTHIHVEGSIQPEDFIAFVQTEDWANRNNKVFADLTQATFQEMSSQKLIGLARVIKPFTREGVRGAYLVRNGLEYGLANIFKVYAEQLNYPVQMEIFTNKANALNWLLDGDSQ